jgi:predicted mannosyl-3-phosphoglycerate phosphatase (HAD superfamily)
MSKLRAVLSKKFATRQDALPVLNFLRDVGYDVVLVSSPNFYFITLR